MSSISSSEDFYDVIVIGGGQAGLSMGFYLRRTNLSYLILDAQEIPGGAWLNAWDSLKLFSPAQWSSLPGWLFPGKPERYPSRDEVVSYFEQYEERYKLPIKRPVQVSTVNKDGENYIFETAAGNYSARTVVSATGSWQKPYIPLFPAQDEFEGVQVHSAHYKSPDRFAGENVLIVGGGNSGAQIMAEVSLFSDAIWVTLEEPQFLPDDVDGRVLFDRASEQYRALIRGEDQAKQKSGNLLGHIVMVESVKAARNRDALKSRRPFISFTKQGVQWADGSQTAVDTVIWCTGYRPALDHLRPLEVVADNGLVETRGTRSIKDPNLWLVGYGNWAGFASATLVGVGRSARATVQQISDSLKNR